MITYRKLLIAGLIAIAAFIPVSESQAQRIHVSIGDRPYYTRGPYYWQNDVRYVWVPGRWSVGREGWIRGRYIARERRTPLQRLHRRHKKHRAILFGR